MGAVLVADANDRVLEMTLIKNLEYISRSGHRAGVGHPTDDPYLGSPKSDRGLRVMREGPIGLAWTVGTRQVERHFDVRIQAALDTSSNSIVVIGHWGASLIGSRNGSKGGLVLTGDGSPIREIELPSYVSSAESDGREMPEALTVVKRVVEGIEIWISHDEGRWHERRIYFPASGTWGATIGQYKSG